MYNAVVLHDVENTSLPRLPRFLGRLDSSGVEFRQVFQEDFVITRRSELSSPLASQITR
jgi:hypothetical protein